MILVTTGSSGGSFDRLLSVVERFAVDDDVVVQHGPSRLRPRGAKCIEFAPFEELSRLVAGARLVVSHAGVGSILLCISHGQVPIVVPRLAALAEAIDDHQLVLARRLARSGTVTCVEDVAGLPAAVKDARGKRNGSSLEVTRSPLEAALAAYVDSLLCP